MQLPVDHPDRNVCIVGLGYVGLTLAVAMAEVGFRVYGVERDAKVVEAVKSGRAHFSEAGLDLRLASQVSAGALTASQQWPQAGANAVYIVTVGTPLGEAKRTNLRAIQEVSAILAERLRPRDLVILRSTVRVGVSREIVKPALDGAKVPYGLAFCPERTLEGRALVELRTLPQVVGGLDDDSTMRASQLFNFVTPTTIRVHDLETAEMIKLINNTQRDLMFGFANEVAAMCDAVGVSAVEAISAGNMGYARASMPMPGPVGGPCLEKDPYILAEGVMARGGNARLALLGRTINEALPEDTAAFVADALRGVNASKIAVAGVAFKGRPETSDLRGTPAIPLFAELRRRFPHAQIVGFDPAVQEDAILALGVQFAVSAADAFRDAACVIFQNNNPRFESLDLGALSETMVNGALIYDLWNQFDTETLSLHSEVRYCGLGSRVLLRRNRRVMRGGTEDAKVMADDASFMSLGA